MTMKGFLNLLAKANLIELSEEERAASRSAEPVREPAVDPAYEPPVTLHFPEAGSERVESRPVEEIYAAANLPPSPFPAEKLLRLLEGLSAMDAATRKAAVVAMDAADDNWQISDSLGDAERKVGALSAYKDHMLLQLQSVEQQTAAQIEAIRAELAENSTEIRKQISELEQLLEREITKSAQRTTALEAEMRSAREMTGTESRRIDTEIGRLLDLSAQFKA
jgi:hypothetical protein